MPYDVFPRTVHDLLNDDTIDIPEHQRPYVWSDKQAGAFITTVVDNLPTQSIFIYEEIVDGKLKRWLEDGQQRFLTLKKFITGEKDWYTREVTRKYAELSPDDKMKILNYRFTVNKLERMTYAERIRVFQNLQDGKPLTNGQRFNAMSGVSPLVKLAYTILSNDECIAVLGPQNLEKDKSKNILTNAVAFAAGLALPDDAHISNSFVILGPELSKSIDERLAFSRLKVLLGVFREANRDNKFNIKQRRKWWTVSTYTGFVLYAIRQSNFAELRDKIVQHIRNVTNDKDEFKKFKMACPEDGNLNVRRWKAGLAYIEDPEKASIYSNEDDSDDE